MMGSNYNLELGSYNVQILGFVRGVFKFTLMFSDSHFMIKTSKVPGTVTLQFQFSEAISVFTSSQFYIDPLRPLVALGVRRLRF